MIRDIPENIGDYLSYDSITGIITWIKKHSLNRVPLGCVAGCIDKEGYRVLGFKGYQYKAHRVAWFLYHGTQPPNVIDHINGDASDNRIVNFRKCTKSENMMNSKIYKNNTSGFKGVYWNKQRNKWQSYISVLGVKKHLGFFDNIKDAVKARKATEKESFGEFRREVMRAIEIKEEMKDHYWDTL